MAFEVKVKGCSSEDGFQFKGHPKISCSVYRVTEVPKKVKVVLQAEFQMRMELKNLVSSKFQSLVELQRVKNLQRTKAFEN